MKRIAVMMLALACILLLGGCQVAQLIGQGKEEASQSSVEEEPAVESREGASAPLRIQPPNLSPPGQKPTPSSREPAPSSMGEDSLTRYIGMTFEQLVDAYGPSEIYHWFDLGLYCGFEGLPVTFCFEFEMALAHYPDVSDWVMDANEFSYGDLDPMYNFETGQFAPSDFVVAFFSVGGEAFEQLLDELELSSPVALETLNDAFGQIRAIEEFGMTGELQAGMYSRDGYQYEFTFDQAGRYATSARIQLDSGEGPSAIFWCDGVALDDETIWLREPTSHGQMDGGGGAAYILAPPLTTLFRTAPPQEGGLYWAQITDGMVMRLDLVTPPEEGDIHFVLWLYEEVQQLLSDGMTTLIELEPVFVEGQLCYTASMGTDHADHFVRERHFAVDVENWTVYEYDVLTDSYSALGFG